VPGSASDGSPASSPFRCRMISSRSAPVMGADVPHRAVVESRNAASLLLLPLPHLGPFCFPRARGPHHARVGGARSPERDDGRRPLPRNVTHATSSRSLLLEGLVGKARQARARTNCPPCQSACRLHLMRSCASPWPRAAAASKILVVGSGSGSGILLVAARGTSSRLHSSCVCRPCCCRLPLSTSLPLPPSSSQGPYLKRGVSRMGSATSAHALVRSTKHTPLFAAPPIL
jgi:hypothetical protein